MVLVCAAASTARAMSDADGTFTNTPPEPNSMGARVDTAHRHLSDYVEACGCALDALLTNTFGGGPPDTNVTVEAISTLPLVPENGGGSRVLLAPSIAYSEKDGLEYHGRFSARVVLPRFKDRVEIIANNIQEDEDVLPDIADPISRDRRVAGEDDKVAGLRLVLVQNLHFDLSTGVGLRFTSIEPVPKLRVRARLKYVDGPMRYELAETGFWQGDDGFGQKTEATIARRFSDRFTVRNTGAALIKEETQGVDLGETLALRYVFPHRRSLGLTLGVQWTTKPDAVVDEYSVRLPFRQGIWRKWLYLQIEPGADFANEDEYDISPLINVGLEIAFGNPTHR